MYNITPNLIWICPLISLICLIVLTVINVYKLIRRNFSVKVNCWFCNQWTKVPYNNQNSFECPSCLQYNGFNADGDYNCIISAQYDQCLNKSREVIQNKSQFSKSNGLCRICNNNQQLRVFQLANFIPLNEANFDIEIEHFEKQLDKAYKLCEKCENVVKKTIQKQNSHLGIKLTKLSKKGISLIDLTTSSNGISKHTKRSILKNVLFYTIIFFACLNIAHLTQFEVFYKKLHKMLPEQLLLYGATLQNLYSLAVSRGSDIWNNFLNITGAPSIRQNIKRHILDYDLIKELYVVLEVIWVEFVDNLNSLISFNFNTNSSFLLYFAGTLLQFIWLFVNDVRHKKNIFLLLVWTELLCLESGNFEFLKGYTTMLQIGSALLIVCLMFFKNRPKKIQMRKKDIRTNLPKKICNDILGNISDDEVIDGSNKLSNNVRMENKVKSVFGNKTQCKMQKNCDNFTATNNSFSTVETKNNSIDLDISLNKLHIGTQAAKKPVSQTPYLNPNPVRPKPVLSPAKLQNISPVSWSKNNSSSSPDHNRFINYQEPNHATRLPPNSFFDSLGCQSLFPDSMFNLTSTPVFGNHISLCCPRFPYTNNLNCNTPFRPLLNNEQLVYLTPNFVQSSNIYEIFPSQNVSTNNFDTSYNDKFINPSGDSFRDLQKLTDLLQRKTLEKK